MGLTITATNAKYEFDIGYGGFFRLRKNIALTLDQEFGELYGQLIYCHTPSQFEDNDRAIELLINRKHLDEKYKDILDFLYMSDCEGQISYKTCKQIYDLICHKNFDDKYFRYAAYAHNDYEEFKEFLKDCYSHHKNMKWY